MMFTDLTLCTLCSVYVVCINLKGLQIKVGMNFCVDPKRAKVLRKKIKKIEGVKLVVLATS